MTFVKDLAIGKDGEEAVIALFIKHGIPCLQLKEKENRPLYDLRIELDGSVYYIECKKDVYAAKSGNIAIEYFNSKTNKASGITVTRAEIWACILTKPPAVYLANVARLLRFTREVKPLRLAENAGDGNANLLLYRAQDIMPAVFTRADTLNTEEFTQLVRRLVEKEV